MQFLNSVISSFRHIYIIFVLFLTPLTKQKKNYNDFPSVHYEMTIFRFGALETYNCDKLKRAFQAPALYRCTIIKDFPRFSTPGNNDGKQSFIHQKTILLLFFFHTIMIAYCIAVSSIQ